MRSVTSTSPQTRAFASRKDASARETPGTPRKAFSTVVPQLCWHIMPSMLRTWAGGPVPSVISNITGWFAPL